MSDTDAKFVVEIELGNAAMQTREDVADSLDILAARLRNTSEDEGTFRDLNGNTVGRFTFHDHN